MATNNVINSTNVSNLTPEVGSISTTLSKVNNPKAFGDQIKNKALDKIKSTALDTSKKLKEQIEEIVKKKIELEVKHKAKLLDLENRYKEKSLTQEEYDEAVFNENINYDIAKETLEKEQEKLQKQLDAILKDPYKKQKAKFAEVKKKFKDNLGKAKKVNSKVSKERKQALFKAAKKTITPILILLITEGLIKIVGRLDRLQNLVNRTNDTIRAANTQNKINQARILRDNAIKELDRSQKEVNKIISIVKKINIFVTIFGTIITLLGFIPTPTPPKIPTTIQKASAIVSGLGYALGVTIPFLQNNIIARIQDLRRQLLQINDLIDGKTALALPPEEFTELLASIGETPETALKEYKGFKFAIKEEENPQFVVKGNKRRYAVAIDSRGVEVIKSEYSFTLDPQVLIDQLKLVIDQQNLEA